MAISKATKEVVWLRKFIMELRVIAKTVYPMILFCDNSGLLLKPKNQGIIVKASTSKGSIT